MEALKTTAVIYETNKDKIFKGVLDKLLFQNSCFTFIRIDPKQESTYTFTDGELAKVLESKLDVAEDIYIINPKGDIAPFLHNFLNYSEQTGKPIRYMYKFCYKDCKYRKSNACSLPSEHFFIPDFHKLLPACENYTRIYDDLLVGGNAEPQLRLEGKSVSAVLEAHDDEEDAVAVED